ncbi:uncharacterized protein [Procambarus clarkii]|uniref:uncharacterized protein n=1 Tax=Procambarus clarkii TaxID=6728 RepID=UPI001E6741E8|nr:uncharacterized protein LOC123754440 [Procambarus clarkii]
MGVATVTSVEMWAWLLVWAGVVVGVAQPASVNMKNLRVKVPRVAYIGDDVQLECTFPWTDPRYLYSIKWWKNNDQFYQYIPMNPYPKMTFNVSGITVDSENSTEFKVNLKSVSLKSSGMFTCEVISDDNFETFRESANMTVIDPPDRNTAGKFGPVIEVAGWSGSGPLEVRDGEQVEALCLARGANPPVQLAWFNNYTKVPRELVRPQPPRAEGFNTYTSTLSLVVSPGQQVWDDQGRLVLRCVADIPGLFHETADLEVHNAAFRRAQLSGLFAGGRNVNGSPVLVTCMFIALLVRHAVTQTRPCS